MPYDSLLKEAEQHDIYVYEKPLQPKTKGLYADQVICINQRQDQREKVCTLAEELGHYHTTVGNILDQTQLSNRKQEKSARTWAYKRLISLHKIVQAHKTGIRNRYELAEYLAVTEEFLADTLKRYQEIYGTHVKIHGYTICFEPLGVIELID